MKPLPPAAELALEYCDAYKGDAMTKPMSEQEPTVSEADVIIAAARLRGLNALKDDHGQIQHEKVRKALEALAAQAPERCARCGRETKGEAAQVGTEVWCHIC